MSRVSIENLTFSYDGSSDYIFKDVNFSFDTDWKIGFIGRNGRGKTTFLNLLLGKYEFKGKILHSVNFDYFPYILKDKNKSTIEIIEEINPEYELWEIMKNMSLLGLNDDCIYQNFSLLSNGEQTKLMLAILFSKENNFLLIDEPTNHLDYDSRISVSDFLKHQKGFIVVSHDRDFIDNCVDHIISINKENIEIQKGNFSSWWQNKQNSDNFELMQNDKLKKDISRLKESAKQTKVWSDKVEKSKNGTRVGGLKVDKGYVGHKAAKMMQRSKSIENRQNKAIEEKSKLLKNIEKSEDLFLKSNTFSSEKPIAELKDVSIFYEDKNICKNINFEVYPEDKICLKGANGSGKTSILKLILGEDIKYKGFMFKNSRVKISYICQNFNFKDCIFSDFAEENKVDSTKFFTLLAKLGFEKNLFGNKISTLSEGQRKKIVIAKSLCEEANLYIWDEPLNYIDVISRMQIENLLKAENITLLFVEHDISFVNNVSTKIVEI